MTRRVEFDDIGIADALERNRLSVPVNQRTFAWEREHVMDYLTDIERAIDNSEAEYFLGTMVCIKRAAGELDVADGQQRLATTIILLAAFRDYLFADKTQSKLVTEISKYLSSFDMKLDTDSPKLTLSSKDNAFFRTRILAEPGATERIDKVDRKLQSHIRIDLAAQIARDHVKRILSTPDPAHKIKKIKTWVTFLKESARVILVIVPDPGKAFTIFETLNDRGLKLSQVDLLKNHIFGLASTGGQLDEAQARWNEMFGALEANGYEALALDYIRQLWISYNGHIKEENLFDAIKQHAKSPAKAVEFAGMLSQDAAAFTALLNPSHPLWAEQTNATKRCITIIVESLRVDRIRPLLLSILASFKKKDVERAFRLCVSWTVRLLIVGGIGSGTIEKFYAEAAEKVRKGTLSTPQAIANEMRKHVPTDSQFKDGFATANVSRSYFARYYLHVLERLAKDNKPNTRRDAILSIDDEPERYDLEHILPQKESTDWPMDEEVRNELVNRIGNLALLEKADNSDLKSAGFDKKKLAYADSRFTLTQKISGSDSWGQTEIDHRQKMLADLAVKAWSLKIVN